jgi:hypothetical protein
MTSISTGLYSPALAAITLFATSATAQLGSQSTSQQIPPAAYESLTNPLSSATNFNIETVRGLLLTQEGLFAINTHASKVVLHADVLTPAWEKEWPTVHNPVAITEWNGRLLVVGGSSWSLVEHNKNDGRILRHVQLPAEPADIVVDRLADAAYIACQGANVVVRIDLVTFTESARYQIPSQRPRFLSFDATVSPPRVLVAPSLSGNNTTLDQRVVIGGDMNSARAKVVDLGNIANSDLPDEDLFAIDTSAAPVAAVTAVLHGAGTLMAEHGRNPATGDYWLLSTESLNAAHNSEDQHRGVFAYAQLAIAATLGGPGRPVPTTIKDLDVPIGGGAKGVQTSMSAPFAMAFHSSGIAAIAASTSDLITVVSSSGVRMVDLPITQQTHATQPPMPSQVGPAIPRDLWWHEASATLLVYCWGWNKVLVYNANQWTAPPFWLELGPDPMPVAAQRGRGIFYDAKRPVANDASGVPFPGAVTCGTCHPAGGMDLLAWGLSDSTKDIKDLMVTQSLLSISDTFPYHWRGERNLDHFNGAFEGLLGFAAPLDETPGGELDQFEAFVFSLQAPANPHQDVTRELVGQDAKSGQDVFLHKDNVLFGFSCADCHAMPAGTNGDNVAEVFINIPSTGILDITHLRQMTHKDQTPVSVMVPFGDGSGMVPVERARGGFGIRHDGSSFDIEDFLKPNSQGGPFNITPTESVQLTAFMQQFDQGIAPAAHRTYFANAHSLTGVAGSIRKHLLGQAAKGWVSVAAIGYEDVAGVTKDLTWAYDANTALFTSSDATMSTRSWAGFQLVLAGTGQYLFVGLPPANAFRFALDPDNDHLTDAQEAALPVASNSRDRDSDGDGYEDGYEVEVSSSPVVANVPLDGTLPDLAPGSSLILDHQAATFAKFYAKFTEPVIWQLEALDMNATPPQVVSVTRSTSFAREAMIHMHELYASTPSPGDIRSYAPRLTITDPRGNQRTITGATFQAKEQLALAAAFTVLIDDLDYTQPPARSGSSMTIQANVKVRFKVEQGGPLLPPGRIVIAHVLKRSAGSDTWTISSGAALAGAQLTPGFDTSLVTPTGTQISAFTGLPGDFLLSSPTDSNGIATFDVTHHGLAAGDDVRINIVAVAKPVSGLANPTFELLSLFEWDLPRTQGGATPTVPNAKDLRGLTTTF